MCVCVCVCMGACACVCMSEFVIASKNHAYLRKGVNYK